MAVLKQEDLELEILPFGYIDWKSFPEFDYKVTMKWKGVSVINETVMKRDGSYWAKGKEGGFVASEQDKLGLIENFEACIKDKKSRVWEAWPDPDMAISIYPDRNYPYLDEAAEGYFSIIVSPDSYQFKDSNCYTGFSGVSLVMVVETSEIIRFVSDLRNEFNELINTEEKKHSNYFLTEEEIQKLRKEREEFSAYASGKFKKVIP